MYQKPPGDSELDHKALRQQVCILFSLFLTFAFCLVLSTPTQAKADELNMDKVNAQALQALASSGVSVKQVALGGYHSAAVTTDGKLYTWGWGDSGQLGLGPDWGNKDANTPQLVSFVSDSSSGETSACIVIYRLLNVSTGEHLYTAQKNEHDYLSSTGAWKSEGEAWKAPTEGKPVYRLYNPSLDDHLYTTDENEKNVLKSRGWQIDNNGNPFFYSGGSTSIYRLYNKGNGRHLITKDTNEYNVLSTKGWTQEGIKLNAV